MNGLFKGNATIIGEWANANHVECEGTRKPNPPQVAAVRQSRILDSARVRYATSADWHSWRQKGSMRR